jgi:preprotein translocase subunit SecE
MDKIKYRSIISILGFAAFFSFSLFADNHLVINFLSRFLEKKIVLSLVLLLLTPSLKMMITQTTFNQYKIKKKIFGFFSGFYVLVVKTNLLFD